MVDGQLFAGLVPLVHSSAIQGWGSARQGVLQSWKPTPWSRKKGAGIGGQDCWQGHEVLFANSATAVAIDGGS